MINNEIISDFKMIANYFNSFFASHCTSLNNNSKVPESQTYITDSKLCSFQFEDEDIIKIIRSLDINKAHGYDDISIMMLKISDLAIIKPISIILRNCINNSTFPDLWKKSNICPIHKKGDKQTINNYGPVSLLPIFEKIFKRLIFNSLFGYHEKYKLLSPHLSGFRAIGSCVDQLLSIVHDIYTAFDEYPTLESRAVFLDMYKALIKYGMRGSFLNLNQWVFVMIY